MSVEEGNFIIGMSFIIGILGIGVSFAIFVLKKMMDIPSQQEISFIRDQLAEIKKELARLCERMGKEETKSHIYHEKHELEDK